MIIKDLAILSQISEEVLIKETELLKKQLLDEVLLNPKALGLSAIQIGIPKRIFVTLDSIDRWSFWVNPILEEIIDPQPFKFVEGCLSFPGKAVRTSRPRQILVSSNDNEHIRRSIVLTDIDSVVFQHELDHLNGKLMFSQGTELQMPVIALNIPRRNDFCNCGSGKKYKKCCGK